MTPSTLPTGCTVIQFLWCLGQTAAAAAQTLHKTSLGSIRVLKSRRSRPNHLVCNTLAAAAAPRSMAHRNCSGGGGGGPSMLVIRLPSQQQVVQCAQMNQE